MDWPGSSNKDVYYTAPVRTGLYDEIHVVFKRIQILFMKLSRVTLSLPIFNCTIDIGRGSSIEPGSFLRRTLGSTYAASIVELISNSRENLKFVLQSRDNNYRSIHHE